MKSFFIWLLAVGTLLPQTTAYGPRGALERVLYYYAYVADELVNPDGARTVAVGCIGKELKSRRCTLDEFLMYIWSPLPEEVGGAPDPKIIEKFKGKNVEDVPVSRLYNTIVAWKGSDGRRITGNTDSMKLLTGAIDFYDCLARIAGPIGMLEMATFPEESKKKLAKKILSKGKTAAQALYYFRLKDIEGYRIDNLKMKLGNGKVILKKGENVEGLLTSWETLDEIATAEANEPNGRAKLDAAIMAYYTGGPQAIMHHRALVAADQARQLSKCPLDTT